ncbi:MAG: hypothetical protein ACEPO8_01280 [Rhodothermaceae bacterium]
MIKKILFVILIYLMPVIGQSKYKLNFESGYLYSDIENNNSEEALLTKLELRYSYKYKRINTKFKIQPGFTSSEFSPKALKLKGEFSYQTNEEKFNYGFNTFYQLNNYYENKTYQLSIMSFNTMLSLMVSKRSDVSLHLSYYKQKSEFMASQDVDRISSSLNLSYFANRNFQFNYGMFYERFFIDSESNFLIGERNQNNGYRVGPIISINYTKNFIARLKYRYLYQKTEVFNEASIEHSVRLVTGKLLSDKWSLFVLIDYTQPVYNFELQSYTDKNLLYVSTNYENNYYLKLARKLGKKFSIYTKVGYFNESIKYLGYDFKGWNCLLGIELQ